jgi:type II secretory ATPase GspE/PulE/Tfp pilus assembly ATPase PilB-like protein
MKPPKPLFLLAKAVKRAAMPVTGRIRKEIINKSSAEQIKEVAVAAGMLTLREDGWRKVKKGVTTIPEILKVTLEN